MDAGVAKCYPKDAHFSSNGASLAFGNQTTNTQSTTRNVIFSANAASGPFTANGLVISGDFLIASSTGVCSGSGNSNSTCSVNVAAKPRVHGPRVGYLSWDTNYGTVVVSLSATGTGLVNLASSDLNSSLGPTLTPTPVSPSAMRGMVKPVLASVRPRAQLKCDAPSTSGSSGGDASSGGSGDLGSGIGAGSGTTPLLPDVEEGSSGFRVMDPTPLEDTGWHDTDIGHGSLLGRFIPQPFDKPHVINKSGGALNDVPTNLATQDSSYAGALTNLSIGNQVLVQDDFASRFAAPLSFTRVYNSQAFLASNYIAQDVGIGWRSNWDSRIYLDIAGNGATVIRGTSGAYTFTFDGTTSTWIPQAGVTASLVQTVDGSGFSTGWQFNSGDGVTEIYDALGRLATLQNVEGTSYSLTYDANGRLQRVQNNYGRALTFGYDTNGRLSTLTDPAGGVTQYGYGSLGQLTSVTYADLRTRGYQYTNATWPFALTGVVDGMGTVYATYGYDAQGRVASSQFAGAVGASTYGYVGTTSTYTDPAGTVWNKTFGSTTGAMQPVSETVSCSSGCPSQASQSTYTGFGALQTYTDRAGIQTRWDYGARNLPVQITEAVGTPEARVTTLTYHPTLNRIASTTTAGRTTSYQFDTKGRVTTKTISSGTLTRTVTYSYNNEGLITQIDDARTDVSDVTSNVYDALGNLTSTTSPTSKVTTYNSYNSLGLPGTITYPDGTVRSFTYDARGRVLTETYAGNTKTNAYDANGNLATVSSTDGSSITSIYDTAQRLTGLNNQLGEKIRYTLDSSGRQTRIDTYDVLNNVVSTVTKAYDGLGRVSRIVDANGKITDFQYDANGNVVWVRDPLLNILQTAYDHLKRPISITGPLSFAVTTSYNAFDQITSIKDPRNNSTTYTYNGLGDRGTLASPDTGSQTFTYDAAGNVLTKQDARGYTATSQYDAATRLTNVTFTGGQTVSMTYDTAVHGVTRLAQITDPSGYTSFTYDANGRLSSKTQAIGVKTFTVQYTRDSMGRVTGITYPSGKVLTIAYTQDRVTSLSWNGATVISGVQYFPFGAPESWLFGGATEYTRYIDQNNRVWKYLVPSGYRTLTYDDAGRVTQLFDSNWATSQTYGYDANGRITSFGGFTQWPSSETRAYTYDANGDRLTAQVNGVSSTYTYSPTNNRLASVAGGTSITNSFDAAGNTLADGQRVHTYDARGRLTQTVWGSTTTQYNYNGFGQRVFKWFPSTSTGVVWVYDEAGNPIGKYDYPSGNVLEEMVWLGSTPVAVAANIPIYCSTPPCTAYGIAYIWTDHLNTPRAITNQGGARIWQWDSAPFGETSPNSNPSGLGSFSFNHRFPGQYFDGESGLHHNGARTYDPAIGRYIQSDPTGLGGGLNTYSYALGNPISYVDSDGTTTAAAGFVGGTFVCGPVCGVVGAVIGGVGGYLIADRLWDALFSQPKTPPVAPPTLPSGWDGTTPPGPGWEWRGQDPPGGDRGGWVSPDGSQSLHPDFDHKPPKGPHVDWNDPFGGGWDIWPDGSCTPKP